jgi:hypothetical protein
VTLSAPEGYFYQWSNGASEQSINVTEAGIYSVTISDDAGCFGISSGVQITIDPIETPTISVEGDTSFCVGGSVVLTASEAAEYLWSNGETSQSVEVSESGAYTVTIQGLCQAFSSAPQTVAVFEVAAPTAEPDTITAPASVLLTATGNNPHWYDQPEDGNLLAVGAEFQTPELSETTLYYVEDQDVFGGGVISGGMPDHTGASAFGGNQFNGQIIFDCLSPFNLKQVKVYTDTPGERIVTLLGSDGEVLFSKTVNVPLGESLIFLDFAIEPGSDLVLTTDGQFNQQTLGYLSPRLRRNNSGVSYPYQVGDVAVLKNSNFGLDLYYYFYDWQVEIPGIACISERTEVEVYYKDISSAFEAGDAQPLRLFPNPSGGDIQIELPQDVHTLRIFNPAGLLILEQGLQGAERLLNLQAGAWPGGWYIVQALGERGVYFAKWQKV